MLLILNASKMVKLEKKVLAIDKSPFTINALKVAKSDEKILKKLIASL